MSYPGSSSRSKNVAPLSQSFEEENRSPSGRPRQRTQGSLDNVTLRFLKVASDPTLRKDSDFVDLVASGNASRLHRGLQDSTVSESAEPTKVDAAEPTVAPVAGTGGAAVPADQVTPPSADEPPLDAIETQMASAANSDALVERSDSCAVRFLLHPWTAVFLVIVLPLADLVSDALFFAELRRASGCYGRTAHLRDRTANGRVLALTALIFGIVAVLMRLYFFRRVWIRVGKAAKKDGAPYSTVQRFKATALMYRAVVRARVDARARGACGCGVAKLAEFLEGIFEGTIEVVAIALVSNSFGFTSFAFFSFVISLFQVSRVVSLYTVEFLCCCCRLGKAQRLLSTVVLAAAGLGALAVISISSDLVSKVVWLEVSSSELIVVDPATNMTTRLAVSWCPTGVFGTLLSSEAECFFETDEEATEALEEGGVAGYPFVLDPYHIVLNQSMAARRAWGLFPEYTRDMGQSIYFDGVSSDEEFLFDDVIVDEVSTNLKQQYRGLVTEPANGSTVLVPDLVFSTMAVRLRQVGTLPNFRYAMDLSISGHLLYALFGECGRASTYEGPGTAEDRAFADVYLDSTELPACGPAGDGRRASALIPICTDQYESTMCEGPVDESRDRFCPDDLTCCSEPGLTFRFDANNELLCTPDSECGRTCGSLVREFVLSSVVVGENIACSARDVVKPVSST